MPIESRETNAEQFQGTTAEELKKYSDEKKAELNRRREEKEAELGKRINADAHDKEAPISLQYFRNSEDPEIKATIAEYDAKMAEIEREEQDALEKMPEEEQIKFRTRELESRQRQARRRPLGQEPTKEE